MNIACAGSGKGDKGIWIGVGIARCASEGEGGGSIGIEGGRSINGEGANIKS